MRKRRSENPIFQKHIRSAMGEKNITVKELTSLTGIPSSTMYCLVRGVTDEPTPLHLARLQAVFGDEFVVNYLRDFNID